MEYKCDLITDEIWERARAGESLPSETRQHLDECPKCRRLAAEVQAIIPMMQVAAPCVPPAPDCRSAVMDRISARPIWRSTWAYAAASVLLVAVIAAGLLAMHLGAKQSPRMVNEPKPEVRQETAKPQVTPNVKPQVAPEVRPEAPKPQPAPAIVGPQKIQHPKRIHLLPKQRPTQLVKHVPPKQEPAKHEIPAGLEPEQVVTFDDEPVAAVAVSWPDADDQQVVPASYGYTDRDVTTGEVTFCNVRRSADTIYVNLESKSPRERPGKGA